MGCRASGGGAWQLSFEWQWGGDVAARRHPRHERATLADRLYEVQERVYGGRIGLGLVREAVATRAPVVGPHVDRFGRAAFHDLYVDASTRQRAALEDGGDRRPGLSLRGAQRSARASAAAPVLHTAAHSAGIWMRMGGDHISDLVMRRLLGHTSHGATGELARTP